MITLTRRRARLLRAAVRRCSPKGRPRGPNTPLKITCCIHGTLAYVPLGEVTVGCRLSADMAPERTWSLPLELLASFEGSDDSLVTLETMTSTEGRASWAERGQPKSTTFRLETRGSSAIPAMPSRMARIDQRFLNALHETGRCTASENARYALTQLQIRGEDGQVIGTDGKQALIMGGFAFPFNDNPLVPAVPLFGLKDWTTEGPVQIGRAQDGVCVGIGDWLVWLKAETDGRFPDVGSVMRRNATGGRLRIGDDDAARLLAGLPKLPGAADELSPVTVCLGDSCSVRACAADGGRSVEVRLPECRSSGPAVRWVVDRRYLHRALLLGFREFTSRKAGESVLATHGPNSYLFAQLSPESAVGTIDQEHEPAKAVPTEITKPKLSLSPRSVDMRPPDPPPRPEPADGEPFDPLAEAEALRAVLGDAMTRSARLVAALKNYRRQRKALESAWTSLQQLKLGQGG